MKVTCVQRQAGQNMALTVATKANGLLTLA
jgi:hypothetical protein